MKIGLWFRHSPFLVVLLGDSTLGWLAANTYIRNRNENTMLVLRHLFFLLFFCQGTILISQVSTTDFEKVMQEAEAYLEADDITEYITTYEKLFPRLQEIEQKKKILSELGYGYVLKGDLRKGLGYFSEARDLGAQSTPDSLEYLSEQYYYMAYCHHELDELNPALSNYEKSLSLIKESDDPMSYGEILLSIAGIYYQKSDYDNAIIYGEKALRIFEKINDKEFTFYATSYLSLYFYFKQDYDASFSYSLRASEMVELNKFESSSSTIFPLNEQVTVYNTLALSAAKKGKLGEAVFALQNAEEINSLLPNAEKNWVTEFNRAFLDYIEGSHEKSLNGFESVLAHQMANYPDGNKMIGQAHYYMARNYETQGNLKSALESYDASLEAFFPDYKASANMSPRIDGYCRSRRNAIRSLVGKASLLGRDLVGRESVDMIRAEEIFVLYDAAVSLADDLRATYRSEGSKYFLAVETKELFDEAIGFSYGLYEKENELEYMEQCFRYMEKNQNPILLEHQRDKKGLAQGGVPDSLIQKEKELWINYFYFQKQEALALSENDVGKSEKYASDAFSSKKKLDELREIYKNNYPLYFSYKYDAEEVSIQDVQKILKDSQLYVQFYVAKDFIYSIQISNDEWSVNKIGNIDALIHSADTLIATLKNPLLKKFSLDSSFHLFKNHASELYQHLLSLETGNPEYNQITIVNHDFLNRIPFGVLLYGDNQGGKDYLSLNYLIKKISVQYQPSARLMLSLGNKDINGKGAMVMAPFAKDVSDRMAFVRDGLMALPYTQGESEAVSAVYETEVFEGKAATKKQFMDIVEQFRILHLATHAKVDMDLPQFSSILMYPSDDYKPGYTLYDYEIQNLDLNAELVVLSACETGAGKVDRGEGLLSLARSFFYTGVPSVVMTHWQINDRSTSWIMGEFYKALEAGDSHAEALQSAKLNYLNQEADLMTAHPFYWSGIVQMGNGDSEDSTSTPPLWIIGVFGFIVGFFLIRRKQAA